jgi:hypothetical protein
MVDDGPTHFKLQDSDWVGAKWGVYCHLGCYYNLNERKERRPQICRVHKESKGERVNRIAGDQEEREREREMSLVHNVQELERPYQDTQHLMCLS